MNSQRSRRNKKSAQKKQNTFIERFDIFGASLPVFNIKGETQVFTKTGGVMSLFVLMTWLSYGAIKLTQLYKKHNPFISEITEKNFYGADQKLDLNAIKFKQAFTFEGFQDREIKDNPKYVKIISRMYGFNEDGVEFQEMIPIHKCKEEDWQEFADPANGMRDQIDGIRDNSKRGMYCIDQPDDFYLLGNENNAVFQYFEVIMVPCNYLHTEFGYTEDTIHPECIADLQK